MTSVQIAENFAHIKKRMKKSAESVDRKTEDINLVAVSKQQSDERIEAALATGHRVFGENRVQEAEDRWAKRRRLYPDLKLHLIGPLQTNKVREALRMFDVIETLDRKNLINEIAGELRLSDRHPEFYIQVNTGEEPQKSGVMPHDLEDLLSHAQSKMIRISGLMCIPPVHEPAGLHFAFLKKIAQDHAIEKLSMGMSDDFERAIMAGATSIRIGTALFGAR
jgi:hypothetical protein